jgi:tetratricopeptide (TPR) repeat protein
MDEEWNGEGPDPTKEAFFSDMDEMEEEISDEAYELVAHALSLIDTEFYDDAIEVFRQAIGLYTQINKEAEIQAIRSKISEIYILKEQAFREVEIETEEEEIEEVEVKAEAPEAETIEVEEKIEDQVQYDVEELIDEADELCEIEEYEEAIERYEEAIRLYKNTNDVEKVGKVNRLIKDCKELQAKSYEVKEYEELKRREEDFSNQAFDLMGEGLELAKNKLFDQAIEKYEEAAELFEAIDWVNEVTKVKGEIFTLIKQAEVHVKELETTAEMRAERIEKQIEEKEKIEEEIEKREKIIEETKVKKFEEVESKRLEDEGFQNLISNMIDHAEKNVREYELAIKKGKFEEVCPYPEIIGVYEHVKELLIQKGWTKQLHPYNQQIKLYHQKLAKDKKLREIEAKKAEKTREYEESLKVGVKEQQVGLDAEKLKEIEAQRLEELKEQEVKQELEDMENKAEKMAREYEVAIRKGQWETECIYPEILEIYTKAKDISTERGWDTEIGIYKSQIRKYEAKVEKDNKLREIEAKKAEKEKEYEDLYKIKKEDKEVTIDETKLEEIEAQRQQELDEQSVRHELEEIETKAEKMAREYEAAIRKRKWETECVYPEVLDLYEKSKTISEERGWETEIVIYSSQIKKYQEKLDKDNKLRELEAQKAEKDKVYEELHKVEKIEKIDGLDTEKLKEIEAQRLQELEEESLRVELEKTADKAEKMARDYEVAIRKGKWGTECVYPEIIEIYENAKEMSKERGWDTDVTIYASHVRKYKEKLEKDNKLREIEAQKAEKDKAYEEIYKGKGIEKGAALDEAKIEEIEAQRAKELEEESVRQDLEKTTKDADKKAREYEISIRKGKWEIECVYPEIIEIYENAKEMSKERGWDMDVTIYASHIKKYKEKLEKDNKLRELEAQKAEKDKVYEELHKVKGKAKGSEVDEAKIEEIEAQRAKELDEEVVRQDLEKMTNNAEKMVREYELAIRKGKWETECVYPKILEIYEGAKNMSKERGWDTDVTIYVSHVKKYKEKLEKDNKLREIEAKKAEKDKTYEEVYKVKGKVKGAKLDEAKLKEIEAQREIETEEQSIRQELETMESKAERMARDYEAAIRKREWETECVYPEVIEIYEKAKAISTERGWDTDVTINASQIKKYQLKLEKDKKLRVLEAQKAEKQKEYEEMHKIKEVDTIEAVIKSLDREESMLEVEDKKRTEEFLSGNAFDLIDKAEKLVKGYELKIKKEILLFDSPYEEVISIYKDARKIFKELSWTDEASRLINTIKFYMNKKVKDDKLREFESQKIEKAKAFEESLKAPKVKRPIRVAEPGEVEKVRTKEDEISEEAFKMIDDVEKIAKEYEAKLKAGEFPECPYEEIINTYREARKKLEEIGWTDQASTLVNSINHYKEKLEADNKLRVLEADKIRKREEEIQEMQAIAAKSSLKEKELLKQKEDEYLLKQKRVAEKEDLKNQAFGLMDRAKREFNQRHFEEAIKLYQQSKDIFADIGWNDGISMVSQSITMIKRKKAEFDKRQEGIKDQEAKKIELEKKLEEKLEKVRDKEKIEQEHKRLELLELQAEKDKETEISERAYKLLEEGTALLNKKKFDDTYDKYIEARGLFDGLGWDREVSRINNDLLFKLKRERKKVEGLKALREKKLEEKKAKERLFEESLLAKKEIADKEKEEKRARFRELEVTKRVDKKIISQMDSVGSLMEDKMFNEAILNINNTIELLQKSGKEKEIEALKQKLETIKKQSEIPLIVLETLDKDENMESFEVSYKALDRAQFSAGRQLYMKAVSELNEAKHNLKDTKIGVKYIKLIDEKIEDFRQALKKKRVKKEEPEAEIEEVVTEQRVSSDLAYEYMDKANKEERRKNFDKAIDLATAALNIFMKLGAEWSKEQATLLRHVKNLRNKQEARKKLFGRARELKQKEEKDLEKAKQEEDELKARIAQRREERRKRMEELRKKKK